MQQSRRDFLSLSSKALLLSIGADLGFGDLLQAATANLDAALLPVPGKSGLFGLLYPQESITLTASEASGALPAMDTWITPLTETT